MSERGAAAGAGENGPGGDARAPLAYPPHEHLLRDLRIFIERAEQGSHAGLEVIAPLCTDAGSVRAGVLATLVDVVSGEQAARAVHPDWIATSDIVLHLFAPAHDGVVIATPSIMRQGRSTVVIEVALGRGVGDASLGLSTLTFSRIPARSEVQTMPERAEIARTEFAHEQSGLSEPLPEKLGALILDAAAGAVQLPVSPYSANSIGALSGGAMATLIELAAESTARCHGAQDHVTTDLAIHYLAPGRRGPITTRTRTLHTTPTSTLTRVEVQDRGANNRLIAAATATTRKPAPSPTP